MSTKKKSSVDGVNASGNVTPTVLHETMKFLISNSEHTTAKSVAVPA